eukprot:1091572-Pleurochrysis_carterae.AAC.3
MDGVCPVATRKRRALPMPLANAGSGSMAPVLSTASGEARSAAARVWSLTKVAYENTPSATTLVTSSLCCSGTYLKLKM